MNISAKMAGVEDNLEKFLNADRIIIVAWDVMAWIS
jgi:hypothetical protein